MFFPPFICPQSALDRSAIRISYRLSLQLTPLFSLKDGHDLRFLHPYVRLQASASHLSPSVIHLTSSHLFQCPPFFAPFKSYLCLFSFICLSALLSLPNFALLFPSLYSCSAFKLFPPATPSPHRLLSCPPLPPIPFLHPSHYLPPRSQQGSQLDKRPRCRVIGFLTRYGSACSGVTHSPTVIELKLEV